MNSQYVIMFKFKGDKDWDDYQACVTYPTTKLAKEEIERAKKNPPIMFVGQKVSYKVKKV